MLTILIGRAKTGKSDTMLRRMAELGESSQQILLVQVTTLHHVLQRFGGHRRTGKAFFGKNLFSPQKDFFDIAASNFDLVIAHGDGPCRRVALMCAE